MNSLSYSHNASSESSSSALVIDRSHLTLFLYRTCCTIDRSLLSFNLFVFLKKRMVQFSHSQITWLVVRGRVRLQQRNQRIHEYEVAMLPERTQTLAERLECLHLGIMHVQHHAFASRVARHAYMYRKSSREKSKASPSNTITLLYNITVHGGTGIFSSWDHPRKPRPCAAGLT